VLAALRRRFAGHAYHPLVYALLRSTDVPGSVPNGGYRVTAAASEHHVARSMFLNVSEPSADSFAVPAWSCGPVRGAHIGLVLHAVACAIGADEMLAVGPFR